MKRLLKVLLMVGMIGLLTGCALQKDGTTTIQLEPNETGRILTLTQQVNKNTDKEWSYYFKQGNVLIEKTKNNKNSFFVAEHKTTYTFEAEDSGDEVIYCVLMTPDDYENAKVYEYEVNVDNNSIITVVSKTDYMLIENSDASKIIKGE